MKVFYDGLAYKLHAQGGISRYFTNLINHLPPDFTPMVSLQDASPRAQLDHPRLKTSIYPGAGWKLGPLSERLRQSYFQMVTQSTQADLLHPTYYWLSTGRGFETYRQPVVLTVHDMIHEIFAPQMDAKGNYARAKRVAAQSADRIICVSENTKKDLLERCTVDEKITSVIPLASEIDASMSYGDEPTPKKPYFLYVGSRNPNYKNFEILLRAFAQVISVHPEATLCVVGGSFNGDEQTQINQLGLSEAIQLCSGVSDRHLAKLYRCSLAFVYPSLYEGFGIPPLEAMACGTPVVASNIASIPEVVGDGGILFNPQSVDELTDILLTLYQSPAERERWIAQGQQRNQQFSWQKMASQTLAVYQSLLTN
jgi:glycosyltransferase involved in cell wall biosynthesis